MTTILIPAEIEVPLQEAARQQGTTPELLAVTYLRQRLIPDPATDHSNGSENLAEYLGDYIGAVRSAEKIPGGAQMSQNSGQQFIDLLLGKKQERRG